MSTLIRPIYLLYRCLHCHSLCALQLTSCINKRTLPIGAVPDLMVIAVVPVQLKAMLDAVVEQFLAKYLLVLSYACYLARLAHNIPTQTLQDNEKSQ